MYLDKLKLVMVVSLVLDSSQFLLQPKMPQKYYSVPKLVKVKKVKNSKADTLFGR
jgi:hypothetical protein